MLYFNHLNIMHHLFPLKEMSFLLIFYSRVEDETLIWI